MARFPPEPSTLRTVVMTRTAYAQLIGQIFHPPKIFGHWQEHEGTPERRWRDVGMKIVRLTLQIRSAISDSNCFQASGFEMLYQESKGRLTFMSGGEDTIQSSVCSATT